MTSCTIVDLCFSKSCSYHVVTVPEECHRYRTRALTYDKQLQSRSDWESLPVRGSDADKTVSSRLRPAKATVAIHGSFP